jgi:hypothetical protein
MQHRCNTGIGKVPEAFPSPDGFVAIVQLLSVCPIGNEPEVGWWSPSDRRPNEQCTTPEARKHGATPIERYETPPKILQIEGSDPGEGGVAQLKGCQGR